MIALVVPATPRPDDTTLRLHGRTRVLVQAACAALSLLVLALFVIALPVE